MRPLNLVLFGPPGAGKGTQADRIAARFGIPKISTGDILRKAVHDKTGIGNSVTATLQRGELVGDDIMIEIVRDRLSQPDTANGFVLDGFPRTIPQAAALLDLVVDRAPLLVLALVVHVDEVIRRLAKREREDDDWWVVRERLEQYSRKTEPVLAYFRRHAPVVVFDGNRPIDAVSHELEAAILAHGAAASHEP